MPELQPTRYGLGIFYILFVSEEWCATTGCGFIRADKDLNYAELHSRAMSMKPEDWERPEHVRDDFPRTAHWTPENCVLVKIPVN